MRRCSRHRCRRPQGPVGCLPAVVAAFAAGVVLTLCGSYGIVLLLLSLFLIAVVISAWC